MTAAIQQGKLYQASPCQIHAYVILTNTLLVKASQVGKHRISVGEGYTKDVDNRL